MSPDKFNRMNWKSMRFDMPGRLWNAIKSLLKTVGRRAQRGSAERDSVILDAAVAIRSKRLQDASILLSHYRSALVCDPAYINLLGVLQESKGQRMLAREFYRVATSVDPDFVPARRNVHRLSEYFAAGRSSEAIALGDRELRAHRVT